LPPTYLYCQGVEEIERNFASSTIHRSPSTMKNKQIERIIGQIKCPKGFECYKSGFENLCKAEDIGLNNFLLCLEERALAQCLFSVSLGGRTYCECPVRVYICKRYNKWHSYAGQTPSNPMQRAWKPWDLPTGTPPPWPSRKPRISGNLYCVMCLFIAPLRDPC
jgi:hypothetical protein